MRAGVARFVPIVGRVRSCDRSWFRPDVPDVDVPDGIAGGLSGPIRRLLMPGEPATTANNAAKVTANGHLGRRRFPDVAALRFGSCQAKTRRLHGSALF